MAALVEDLVLSWEDALDITVIELVAGYVDTVTIQAGAEETLDEPE